MYRKYLHRIENNLNLSCQQVKFDVFEVKRYFDDPNFVKTFPIDSLMITGVGYEENQIF